MNRLTVALFATSDANYAACMDDYIAGANSMLAKYGMSVEIFPNPAGGPRMLPYSGPVFDYAQDPATIRAQAHNALPVGRGIPVIVCKRNTDNTTTSLIEVGSTIQTTSSANNGYGWPPYILINTQAKSTANAPVGMTSICFSA